MFADTISPAGVAPLTVLSFLIYGGILVYGRFVVAVVILLVVLCFSRHSGAAAERASCVFGTRLRRFEQEAQPQVFVTGDGWFTCNLIERLAQLAIG